MKKSSLLMIVSVILLTACGTASQYASSTSSARFEDGIYSSSPSFISREVRDESQKETEALVERTKASAIYLFGEKKDTVMIPENMSASIRYDKGLGSTVITVGENPYDWQNYINPWAYYTPYSIGSSWYWSRHYNPWYSSTWYWNSSAYSPWAYSRWYDPWYSAYSGWYDPWYYGYGGWYDPWYYGYGYAGWYGGWYSPWYGPMGPHYAGWYGGWDPYWGYHHHHHNYHPHHHGGVIVDNTPRAGSRREATGSRVNGGTSVRRGVASSSRANRELNSTSVNAANVGNSTSRPIRIVSSNEEKQTSGAARPAIGTIRQAPAGNRSELKPVKVETRTEQNAISTSRPATGTARPTANTSRPTIVKQPPTTVQNYRKPKPTASAETASGSHTTVRQSSGVSRPAAISSEGNSSSRESSRSSFSSGSSSSRSSFSSGGSYSGGGASRSMGSSRSGGYSGGRR